MLLSDSYFEIENHTDSLYKSKGSKFYAFAFKVMTEADIKEQLEALRKRYSDATHHCYAYVLGAQSLVFRVNDDGEPANTAGQPIYRQIKKTGFTNILVVVVRYFGGTMLGVPGLIEAYSLSVAECLDKCIRVEKKIRELYTLACNFGQENEIYRLCRQFNIAVDVKDNAQQFLAEVKIPLLKADAFKQQVKNLYQINIKYIGIE
ncbi:MAG: YigZ family protein [Bacteroidota bacterium]